MRPSKEGRGVGGVVSDDWPFLVLIYKGGGVVVKIGPFRLFT